jgi:hypothetical protein
MVIVLFCIILQYIIVEFENLLYCDYIQNSREVWNYIFPGYYGM